jgi:hypothetical protein
VGRLVAVYASRRRGGGGSDAVKSVFTGGSVLVVADCGDQTAALMPFWTLAVPMPSFFDTEQKTETISLNEPAIPVIPVENSQPGETDAEPTENLIAETLPAAPVTPPWYRIITWQSWLLWAWLIVVVMQIVRVVLLRIRLGQMLRTAVPATGELATLMQNATNLLGSSSGADGFRLFAVCLRNFSPGDRVTEIADILVRFQTHATGIAARIGPRQTARFVVGLDTETCSDDLFLSSVCALGQLPHSAGTGTLLRSTGNGPQQPKRRRLRRHPHTSRQPHLGTGRVENSGCHLSRIGRGCFVIKTEKQIS